MPTRLPARAARSCAARKQVYRAGYSPADRRELERQLHSGELLGVAATNALELGVDVGHLDLTLHLGDLRGPTLRGPAAAPAALAPAAAAAAQGPCGSWWPLLLPRSALATGPGPSLCSRVSLWQAAALARRWLLPGGSAGV
jgi:hypothetical protein